MKLGNIHLVAISGLAIFHSWVATAGQVAKPGMGIHQIDFNEVRRYGPLRCTPPMRLAIAISAMH